MRDLARKSQRIFCGEMSRKGSWTSQKRKYDRRPAEVMFAEAGRWLGKFANEGQMALIIWM